MSEISTKPYLIRAIYEWCADATFTPYLTVKVDQHVRVPMEYVKNGEIVLSVSQQATRNLTIGNDLIQFSARFNGVSREISIPIYAVQGIFARENGRGVFFDPEPAPAQSTDGEITKGVNANAHPLLQSVPTNSTHLTNGSHVMPAVATATASTTAAATTSQANEHLPADELASSDPHPHPDKPKGPPRGNLRVIK
jgi:stringent starvation protein B